MTSTAAGIAASLMRQAWYAPLVDNLDIVLPPVLLRRKARLSCRSRFTPSSLVDFFLGLGPLLDPMRATVLDVAVSA